MGTPGFESNSTTGPALAVITNSLSDDAPQQLVAAWITAASQPHMQSTTRFTTVRNGKDNK